MRALRKLEYEPPSAETTVQGQGYGAIWSNHGRTETPAPAAPTETPAPAAPTETPVPATQP